MFHFRLSIKMFDSLVPNRFAGYIVYVSLFCGQFVLVYLQKLHDGDGVEEVQPSHSVLSLYVLQYQIYYRKQNVVLIWRISELKKNLILSEVIHYYKVVIQKKKLRYRMSQNSFSILQLEIKLSPKLSISSSHFYKYYYCSFLLYLFLDAILSGCFIFLTLPLHFNFYQSVSPILSICHLHDVRYPESGCVGGQNCLFRTSCIPLSKQFLKRKQIRTAL